MGSHTGPGKSPPSIQMGLVYLLVLLGVAAALGALLSVGI